jgi:RNA polymerase sigma-70 factor, ECF subfamily
MVAHDRRGTGVAEWGRGQVSEVARGARLLFLPGGPLAAADDAALGRALIDGDPQAPRVVWQRFSPMVHRILKRALGPAHEVEDLAQEVFLCLFEKAATLREPKVLKAFVISITALTIRGELRRKWVRRWVRLHRQGDPPDHQAFHPDPEAREALVRFYAILDRVRPEDRAAFVLRFMEGLELVEVAAALGLSLATAKRRLSRVWTRVVLLVQRDPLLVHYLSELELKGKAK